jgi:hypothetical protein
VFFGQIHHIIDSKSVIGSRRLSVSELAHC